MFYIELRTNKGRMSVDTMLLQVSMVAHLVGFDHIQPFPIHKRSDCSRESRYRTIRFYTMA